MLTKKVLSKARLKSHVKLGKGLFAKIYERKHDIGIRGG